MTVEAETLAEPPAEFVRRVVDFAARHEIADCLWWHPVSVDGYWSIKGRLTCWVNCNDWFAWATADSEEITERSIGDFELAVVEVEAIDPQLAHYGPLLYASRRRRQLPQQPCWNKLDTRLQPLFAACAHA